MHKYFAIKLYTMETYRPVGSGSLFRQKRDSLVALVSDYSVSSGLYHFSINTQSKTSPRIIVDGPEDFCLDIPILYDSTGNGVGYAKVNSSDYLYKITGSNFSLISFKAETDSAAQLIFDFKIKEDHLL